MKSLVKKEIAALFTYPNLDDGAVDLDRICGDGKISTWTTRTVLAVWVMGA